LLNPETRDEEAVLRNKETRKKRPIIKSINRPKYNAWTYYFYV
jgi:hypothetical protein